MTDYTKRLDEILDRFEAGIIGQGMGVTGITFPECKNKLTQLFSDMVREAAPTGSLDEDTSWDAAIDQFEQNLLKALEGK